MKKSRGMATVWIVLIAVGATIIVLGIIALVWYSVAQSKKVAQLSSQSQEVASTSSQTGEQSSTSKTPSVEPNEAAENFLKSIFDTFPGSSVNLEKANTYLSDTLQSQTVAGNAESYWDLHGYIHSGPCKVETETLSKSATAAEVQISAVWGECFGDDVAEPTYIYKMENQNGNWIITEITDLYPEREEYSVPRDF